MRRLTVGAMLVLGACGSDTRGATNWEFHETQRADSAETRGTTAAGDSVGETRPPSSGGAPVLDPAVEEPPEEQERLPSPCSGPDRPTRCDEAPEGHRWSGAALIDTFVFRGTPENEECCFDYDGDGAPDNSLGENLAAFDFTTQLNEDLARRISVGDVAMVLELEGVAGMESEGATRLYWWKSAWAPEMIAIDQEANQVLVGTEWLDEGTQPRTYFPTASVADGHLRASGGTIVIPFPGLPIHRSPGSPSEDVVWVAARDARLDAEFDASAPHPTLRQGRLGAVIEVAEVWYAINEFAETRCACLGLEGPLLDKQTGFCAPADSASCDFACEQVVNSCALYSALDLFADQDLDGDGLYDAMTIGATFSAVPATIVGVE